MKILKILGAALVAGSLTVSGAFAATINATSSFSHQFTYDGEVGRTVTRIGVSGSPEAGATSSDAINIFNSVAFEFLFGSTAGASDFGTQVLDRTSGGDFSGATNGGYSQLAFGTVYVTLNLTAGSIDPFSEIRITLYFDDNRTVRSVATPVQMSAVPLPGSMSLAMLGLAGLGVAARRRKRA